MERRSTHWMQCGMGWFGSAAGAWWGRRTSGCGESFSGWDPLRDSGDSPKGVPLGPDPLEGVTLTSLPLQQRSPR